MVLNAVVVDADAAQPPAVLKKLRVYTADPMINVESMRSVSTAATGLALWVHAMDLYSKACAAARRTHYATPGPLLISSLQVVKEVEPKKLRLEEMNRALAEANAVLQAKQAMLAEVIAKVAALQQRCDETVAEKVRLETELEITKQRLVRAEKLTSGLADEGVRWRRTVETLDAALEAAVGDVFVAAAAISYYGAFTGSFRDDLVAAWAKSALARRIPMSSDVSLERTIGDAAQTREWQAQGLPIDTGSTNNALLVMRSSRWPLLIDPQGQGNRWIRNVHTSADIAVSKASAPNMMRVVDACVRNGKPLLIEDVRESLDAALQPVLSKSVYTVRGRCERPVLGVTRLRAQNRARRAGASFGSWTSRSITTTGSSFS